MLLDWSRFTALLLQFLHSGGWVLSLILALAALLMTLILERYWFRWFSFPVLRQQFNQNGASQRELYRWQSEYCDLDLQLKQHLSFIKLLISLCPLVGLLGTVTGMVQVFDSLALNGTGNARLMAAGIAKATLPTMAGMAIAVFGLIFHTHLARWTIRQRASIQASAASLGTQHG
ncbi:MULTISPECIES: MotA/TolQ/ExbB proton channel family protein [unclassified Agarivorans]|uniref:MotA/TolQ/ExbB proton channel family protein n=1 Tax=unclassified Agarivorans TaxID=2636026 RepID=UPI003D7DCCA6